MAVVLDLCRGVAGREGRPRRRPVRQAALGADREARRRRIAGLIAATSSMATIHQGGTHARSTPAARGLSAIGGDAQSPARVCNGRLCQPLQCASMDVVLRQGQPAIEALSGTRHSSYRGARLHARVRHRSGSPSGDANDRFFHQPRSIVVGLRAGVRGVDLTTGDWYCTSGHMLWVGDRTRQPDHAHIEFCRGSNPLD